jgi:5'-3' exonuclease
MDFIIDGNAYLNVAISVTRSMVFRDKRFGNKYWVNDILNDGGKILKEEIKVKFKDFCLNYLSSLIAPIGNRLDRVHLVFDSKSWRKEYVQSYFIENSFSTTSSPVEFKYKGNRKKDDSIYLFFEYFQNEIVPKLVEESGINYYRIKGTEGDDIIAHLCEQLDEDILIYTVDGDLRQLTHSKNNVMLIYPKQSSGHKKIFVPREFKPERATEEENFFSLTESSILEPTRVKIVDSFKRKEYVEYEVDPVEEIFLKILRGDPKDNIPKMDKITPTKASNIISDIKESYGERSIDLLDEDDSEFIGFIIERISVYNKIKDLQKIIDTRKHFDLNTRLVRLRTRLFPEDVIGSLNEDFKDRILTNFIPSKFNHLKNNTYLI